MVPQPQNNSTRISVEEYAALAKSQGAKLEEMSLTPEEKVLRKFNQKYAVVRTSTTYILVQKTETSFELDSRQSFIHFHENDFFVNSKGKEESKAYFWLKHSERRTFENIVFDPGHPGDYDGNYNIFKGFSVQPVQGDCSLYWTHVQEVICNGDEISYQYVRKWMACVVQRPKVLATALVLRGLQGTGKNMFADLFGRLLGPYYLTVTNLEHVTGKFNNHLKYAYLIHANEAIWGGTKKEVGALKALITDPTIMIEGKGKDAICVDNCRHLIVSSNEDWAVPMDLDDRRFFALNVSADRKGDTKYFEDLEKQMSCGGLSALLYDLLHEDVSDFDPRVMPPNDSGFDMKMKTAGSTEKFLYAALSEGRLNISTSSKTGEWKPYPTKDIYYYYKEWCHEEGLRHETDSEFGKRIKKIIGVEKSRRSIEGGGRERWYEFSSLEECRKRFEKFTKQTDRIWED